MKKIIALSSLAFLSTLAFADADMQKQIDDLKAQLEKLEKSQDSQDKQISKVNAQSAKDNIKFDVDFRTSYDKLAYETASGKTYSNDALYSNRLWLGMGYAPTDEMIFKGQLAFNKAFGASSIEDNVPQRGYGFDAFDWVINENLTDDTLKVREAYWLWMPTVSGLQTTLSVGRRPATNGSLINLRDDDKEQSPLGHVINMEFDGASASVKLDQIAQGMSFKLCLGRGLTNANSRFTNTPDGASIDYSVDNSNTALENVDMAGFIFVPYNDGQYSVKTTWYRGFNVPGMYLSDYDFAGTPMDPTDDTATYNMQSAGTMDGAAISLMSNGIGEEINDFLDETIVFASFAMSKSDASSVSIDRTANALAAIGQMGIDANSMMGSSNSEVGTSIWIGTQMPNLTGGKFGLEYNKGSKYWRPFTYGEDTMIGSKIAVRGQAYEAYWTQPIIDDAFSMQIRYTYLDYDYTGSNGFFGDGGTPIAIEDAVALGMDPVEKASDLRVYFRYRY
ncbi:MAG: DUF3373 family protein [Sulfurimonas sp.]|nr:DUF3373 family protein [Sulfurimonas sp.]MBU3938527.1 DUF3373 family protein [bacterium]MBU4024314.1 DUF3373 family protein [bacterium]MBU4059010.1 DUF3373 family protein [bacterium]MBU4109421.1 DUF3373 family protein [bacterium]